MFHVTGDGPGIQCDTERPDLRLEYLALKAKPQEWPLLDKCLEGSIPEVDGGEPVPCSDPPLVFFHHHLSVKGLKV